MVKSNQSINFLLLILLNLTLSLAHAATISGRVVTVTDGDTITVLDNTNTQHKIRLAGIDAPEKKQAFGKVSKKSLYDLVYGKQVAVDWQKQDRYGRTVGKVVINGVDANLEQIKRGLAWFYSKYQNELVIDDRLNYLHAHEYAQAASEGLWVDKEPMAPWDFRKAQRAD